jgi:MtN3 and saliva related transmembrane protein
LTTAANVPQILKTYKTKSAEGLSFRMILTLAAGLLLWVVYGVTASSLPIIASNSVALLLILALLAMKLKFDRSPAKD